MKPTASHKQIFAYFRMALVTGLIDQLEVIRWADRQLLAEEEADFDLVQLSLAANQSLSQVAWLLNDMQCDPRDVLPYKMVMARAGLLLEAGGDRTVEIIQGIRLIEAEYYVPAELRAGLRELDGGLSMLRMGMSDGINLITALADFLSGYREFRVYLPEEGQAGES